MEDALNRPHRPHRPDAPCRPRATSTRAADSRWTLALLATLAAAAIAVVSGCGEAKADRERAEAAREAQAAIASYSAASQEANNLHGEVIRQFAKANGSTNLPDYREAMRRDVLPAMDRFVARLKGMPTGTPQLKRIHGGLISAYSDARADIAAFVDKLQTARDLERFAVIRKRLQRRVAAYQSDLAAYYKNWNRQLRDGGKPAAPSDGAEPASSEGSAPPAAATSTATAPPAAPASTTP